MKRNATKRKGQPTRVPGERYTSHAVAVAVARACDVAFPPPAPLAKRADETLSAWAARLTAEQEAELAAWRASHRWHPNQLRHTFATSVRRVHGLEAAQALLGHARADVTQIYAERNTDLAVSIAAEVG